MDTNLVVLTGRMTRPLELKYSQSGMAVGSFGLAVQGYKKDAPRDEQPVHFFDVTVFGKTAEIVAEHAGKGYRLMVLGSLSQDRWEDKNTGVQRSRVKVLARQVELWFGKKATTGQEAAGEEPQAHPEEEPQADPEFGKPLSELDDDQIPF